MKKEVALWSLHRCVLLTTWHCGSSHMMDVARDESGGWRGRAQRVLRAENLFGGSPVTVHACLDSLKAMRESPQMYSAASFSVSIIRTYQCILVSVWMSQIYAEKRLKLSDRALAFHPNQSEQTRAMKIQLTSHYYLPWSCDSAWIPHRSLRILQHKYTVCFRFGMETESWWPLGGILIRYLSCTTF